MKKQFLLLSGLMLFISCKKNQDNTPVVQSKTDLIAAVNWREIGHSSNGMSVGNNPGGNLYDLTQACERDNFLKFKSDNTFIIDEGATKCNSSNPQTKTDSWRFINNDSQLVIALPDGTNIPRGQATIYDILELSATKMALKRVENGLQGQAVEEVTFTAF